MESILIAGGTGLVGNKLTQMLIKEGYSVHILSRHINTETDSVKLKHFKWDPAKQTYDPKAFENVIAVINLAGAGIAEKRWTATRKKLILESRTQCGNTISKALLEIKHNVQVLLQASAIGWYKTAQEQQKDNTVFQEEQAADTGYLGQTCKAWEESIASVENSGIRVVKIRIGIVLDPDGGFVKEILKPLNFGILPLFGNGKQLVPWIHQEDLCRLFLYAINRKPMHGVYNGVSPVAGTQKEVTKAIAKVLDKKWFIAIPVPGFILKLLLGEMSIEILKSSEISAEKIKKEGFIFKYPSLLKLEKL